MVERSSIMVNPKKEFPNYVIGILKTEGGYSICEFLVNDEKRIKYIDRLPADMLYIALDQARKKLLKQARGENDQEQQ